MARSADSITVNTVREWVLPGKAQREKKDAYSPPTVATSRPRVSVFWLSALIVILIVGCAILVSVLPLDDPLAQNLDQRLRPPAFIDPHSPFVLGSDALGRDLLSRLLFGARSSLVTAFAATLLATCIGTSLGLVAGFFKGRVDTLLSRLADIQQAIPYLILTIAIVAVLGRSQIILIVVLGLASWVTLFRVVRAETLSLREREFVVAARASGATSVRIMTRHILPNLLGSVLVLIALLGGNIILFEASLGFLGLGVPPPQPSWGGLIAEGREYIADAWWISVVPGALLGLLVLALNLIVDEWEQQAQGRRR
jgi:peptide/nickel transport system permease protein